MIHSNTFSFFAVKSRFLCNGHTYMHPELGTAFFRLLTSNLVTCKSNSGLFWPPALALCKVNPPQFFNSGKCFSRILQTSEWLANLFLNTTFVFLRPTYFKTSVCDADGVFVWSVDGKQQNSCVQVSFIWYNGKFAFKYADWERCWIFLWDR